MFAWFLPPVCAVPAATAPPFPLRVPYKDLIPFSPSFFFLLSVREAEEYKGSNEGNRASAASWRCSVCFSFVFVDAVIPAEIDRLSPLRLFSFFSSSERDLVPAKGKVIEVFPLYGFFYYARP